MGKNLLVLWKREKIELIKMLLLSVLLAKKKVMLEMNVSKDNLQKLMSVLPCMKSPTIAELYGEKGYAIKVAVDRNSVKEIIPLIKKAGAMDILEYEFEKVIL